MDKIEKLKAIEDKYGHNVMCKYDELISQINNWRSRRHLTMKMLGEITGYNKTEISRIERRIVNISVMKLIVLCEALGLEIRICPKEKAED